MKRETTQTLVLTALFAALIIVLGMTPIGMIPLGFVYVTILCVPVIIGTLILGLRIGVVLGACFGLISALTAFRTPSTLVAPILAASPLLVLVMCFGPRLLVPLVAHLVYKGVGRGEARSVKALPFAAVAGSLTNTILYLGLMLLFYVTIGLDTSEVLTVILGTGLIAGASEAVVAAILVTPITVALWQVQKRIA